MANWRRDRSTAALLAALFLSALAINTQVAHAALPDIGLVTDPAPAEVTNRLRKGSHVKLFLPNLPYLSISHAVNASLVRPADHAQGWQYDLATSHRNIDDQVWEFQLRQGVSFQDGTPFNADAVLLNMAHFQRSPSSFSKISQILDRVEKVDDYTVRFYLTEPYGVFLHDAIWLQFYTATYLAKHGWNGKPSCPNLAEPGTYALGPYILHEGYVEGDRSTPEVVLKANPRYWGEDGPKVETITIYTELPIDQARDKALFSEGEIDITPVPFADQVEVVLSPHAKLAVSPSMNNYAMHFNLLNGSEALADPRIRHVINHAIDQEYLLNLSMLGQGVLSPTMVSPNFPRVALALDSLQDYFDQSTATQDDTVPSLRQQVKDYQAEQGLDPEAPLQLTLLVQESFMFLVRDIQYFLQQVNIDLHAVVLAGEKQVFRQLFGAVDGNNEQAWDLLLWGNYDWYRHPWSAFLVYITGTSWSTLPPDQKLADYTDKLLRTNLDSSEYVPFLADIIRYVHDKNYMVFLPTPDNVYAVNKEVVFNPGHSAFIYLRELQVTDQHWSLRGDRAYAAERLRPLRVNRQSLGEASL